jgi:branched-chain amino acid transport system ATP-binding protein
MSQAMDQGLKSALSVQNLHRHYGVVKALNGIDFDLRAGECVAMIGPNGAGKSTCFACLAGQQRAAQGRINWRGQNLDAFAADQRSALGVVRTFQVAQVFQALSVIQNLQLVLKAASGVSAFDSLDACFQEESWQWIRKMGLDNLGDEALHSSAGNLSYGGQKRLELAMAMAGLPDPSLGLLLLDEPAAGLSPTERIDMMRQVKALTEQGTTVLYTEHNMDAVFGVADRVLVLMEGCLVAQGLPHEVAANPLVRDRYLGASFKYNEGDRDA